MKVLTYNSSARGSGQFVRSLKIAGVITSSFRDAQCAILAGNSRFERSVPDRTSIVPMPEIGKSFDGQYVLAGAPTPSPRDIPEAFALRKQIIQSAVDEYDPDFFLVDSRPKGLNDELLDILGQLAGRSRCRSVLMLRDIVDDPKLVVTQWKANDTYRLLDELYDDIVIWGDEQRFDAVAAYDLSDFRNKVTYLGYLGGRGVPDPDVGGAETTDTYGHVLVTIGGGFDGSGIIEAVCDSISRSSPTNSDLRFTIVLGPHSPMTTENLLAGRREAFRNVEILRHVPELDGLIAEASVVVSMCGYNTLWELIEKRKKIIAIPRSHSGAEQLLRARLLTGFYDGMWVVPQNELTADTFERSLSLALRSAPPKIRMEMTGAANLVAFLGREVRVA